MEGKEKRRRIRVPFRTEIVVDYDRHKMRFGGDSVNLSLSGVLVETKEKIALGSVCRVRLKLTGTSEPIELTMGGRVVRQDHMGFGVQFDEMDLDSYSLLKEIIRHNASDPDSL